MLMQEMYWPMSPEKFMAMADDEVRMVVLTLYRIKLGDVLLGLVCYQNKCEDSVS